MLIPKNMKRSFIFLLLISLFIFYHCTKEIESGDNVLYNACPFYTYDLLRISFINSSGNDLIKGIEYDWFRSDSIPEQEATGGEIKRDLYSLEFIYPDTLMDPFKPNMYIIYTPNDDYCRPKLGLMKMPETGIYCLGFNLISFDGSLWQEDLLPPADKISIKLKCPYIFGDDIVHEIDTYWEPCKDLLGGKWNKHVRIDFDGKEVKDIRLIERPTKPDYEFYLSIELDNR